MLLGCIGDDFTGSSDLANTLAREGMRTVQFNGVPHSKAAEDCEAGVVALKSRSIAAAEAVRQSLQALDWLLAQGAQQIVFKYCSTFDSTPQGNIGPVAEALLEHLGGSRAVVCPAFPATGRTVYQGHLFVKDRLLSESGMEKHPLTPMTDPDIRRWLRRQTKAEVGLVPCAVVEAGAEAIAAALDDCVRRGERLVVVDALNETHLRHIGKAAASDRLITGGSGIALGLPENFRACGLLAGGAKSWHGLGGPAAVLAGSCSGATRAQVAAFAAEHPAQAIDVDAVIEGRMSGENVARFLVDHADATAIAYSSAGPDAVAATQAKWGRERVAHAIESLFAEAAIRLVESGTRRLVVAGGETAGAVATGLNRPAFEVGPEIDPGVPALLVPGTPTLALALKSGNFGAEDFFEKAVRVLGGEA
ncbi:MAG: four-carbon acid sugar kinase family protein [Methylobacteriaceae bacterium]|nr:four-carbon acid sugar kinase family protein [Methylobacteriaceae bacterium]